MVGFIVDVSYPDFQKHGVRDKEVIDCVEQHGGRLCNRHRAVRGPASTDVRVIRAFFESEIASVGFVQDMREACIDVDTQVIGLFVEPEPLNVGGEVIEKHLAAYIESPAGGAFVIRTLRESDLGVPELQHPTAITTPATRCGLNSTRSHLPNLESGEPNQ